MKSTATAVIEADGVLRSVFSGPPLTIRRVRADDPATCRLCLVNSAAGPLAGDEVGFELTVGDGARAEVTSAGAAIAQGHGGEPGRFSAKVLLGANAVLHAEPAPLIVCAGARVEVDIEIALAASATLRWQECLVLGRSGESGGSVILRWNVTRAGWPVLRQTLDLSDPDLLRWPGMLGGNRVLVTTLVTGENIQAVSEVRSATDVSQRIDEHTMLSTVIGADTATVRQRLVAGTPYDERSRPAAEPMPSER